MHSSRLLMTLILALSAWLATAADHGVASTPDRARRVVFTYQVTLDEALFGNGEIDLFVPLPRESRAQEIVREEVRAPVPGSIGREAIYGNRFWHTRIGASELDAVEPRVVEVEIEVVRHPHSGWDEIEDFPERFLQPNDHVVVGHDILEPILEEIRAASSEATPAERARAIYDWVVDNIEYKKVGTGWGNGDTFWACNARYGNCTDFHSLFISLARTEGIPARFEMGFPIRLDRTSGVVEGYHCWVELYLPGQGWTPIDASEAFKHPEKRELFFGHQPADRIHFTTGRDLRLGERHLGPPLNYFIHPYVERDGEPVQAKIDTLFRFHESR